MLGLELRNIGKLICLNTAVLVTLIIHIIYSNIRLLVPKTFYFMRVPEFVVMNTRTNTKEP